MTAAKHDAKKDLDRYRGRRGEFRLLEVPSASYLMVDGTWRRSPPSGTSPAGTGDCC